MYKIDSKYKLDSVNKTNCNKKRNMKINKDQ